MGPGVRVPSPRPSTKKLHTSALGMVGIAQLVRAPDCGSGGREFESHYPPHTYDSLAQSVEHLTFNQGVRSSNLRWVTTIWRHDQVAKVEDCNSFIPSSNLGVASI